MLRIELTKRADGGGVLRCVRSDGSVTWQKQNARNAPFFALHDLTHFAVESALGFKRGFFGLIAEGWEIDDLGGKGARGRLPDEAIEVEHLVGTFDSERASGALFSAEDFNANTMLRVSGSEQMSPRLLTSEEILRVRAVRGKLFAQWETVAPGASLELTFEG